MPKTKLTLGKCAVCNVLAKMLHPGEVVSGKYPNRESQLRIHELVVTRLRRTKICRKEQMVCCFSSDELKNKDGSNIEMHCVQQFMSVVGEGPEEYFFSAEEEEVQVAGATVNQKMRHIPKFVKSQI